MEHLTQEQIDAVLIENAIPAEVETHLAACKNCVQALDDAKEQLLSLKSFAHENYERVMHEEHAVKDVLVPFPTAPKKRFVYSPQFAIAAMLFLVLGLTMWTNVKNSNQGNPLPINGQTAIAFNNEDADTLLLQRIASARERTLPQALHPASLLIAERNRTIADPKTTKRNN